MDFIKIKNLGSWKDTVKKKKKRKATDWEKIFTTHISIKGLVARIYKEPLQVTNKKANNITKFECAKDLNRHLTKEDKYMDDKKAH